MKNLNEMSVVPILQLVLIIGSMILAYFGVNGWGWFLIMFILTCFDTNKKS
jgi:hypothetical protein